MPLTTYTAYPDADDVEAFLKSATYWPTDSSKETFARLQAGIAAAGAASEWEQVTGWEPFLASDEDTTLYFDGTDYNGLLSLGTGLLSATTVEIDEVEKTVNEDFWLYPANASNRRRPYTALNFRYGSGMNYSGLPNRIAITGRFGYCTELPADVFAAILQKAAQMTLMAIENLQSVASISQDGFSKSLDIVGISTQKDAITNWTKNFYSIASMYKRVVVL